MKDDDDDDDDSAINVFEAQSDLDSDEESVVQQNHCLTGKAECSYSSATLAHLLVASRD